LSNAEGALLVKIAQAVESLHLWPVHADEPAFPAELTRLVLELGALPVSAALAIEASDAGRERLAELRLRAKATPTFPLSGSHVLARGVGPGPEVGRILAAAREAWINAACPLDEEALAAILDGVLASAAPPTSEKGGSAG
jgi:poly(A) polymerase